MEAIDPRAEAFYSPGQVALAAFLGTPAAACWFISRNCRQLGEDRAATQWLLWGIVGTALMFIAGWFLPDNFPAQGVAIGYVVAFYFVTKQLQGDTVANRLGAGGRPGSWWAVIGISLLFLVVILTIMFGVVFLLPEEYL